MEEEQLEKDNTSTKSNKKIIIIVCTIILVLAIIALIAFLGIKALNGKTVGNTIGNIRNYGYAAEDDKYIYFMAPNEDGKLKTLNRIDKKLEKEPEQLYVGDFDITGINVYKDYIYFVTLESTENSEDTVNNQIHKLKIDASEHNVINNNEFHNSAYEIYVVKDKLYYIGEDEGIYTMNLDGTEKKKMDGTSTGFIGITDKYILYNKVEGQDEEQKIVTHIMNLDGTNDRILTGDRLYSADIVDEYIYYTDYEGHIYRVKIGESNFEMLSSITSYCVNATSDGVYSLKYIDEDLTQQAIFKMNLDGTEEKMIKKLETTSSFLTVTEDWIIYMDSSDTKGLIAMVSKDGKKYQELYSLDFQKYIDELLTSLNEVENTTTQEQ